jgi:NitT/TauT family transport system permease protein
MRGTKSSWLRTLLPPILTFFVIVFAAELIVRLLKVPAWLVPPPSRVLDAIVRRAPDLGASAWMTAKAAFLGFALAGLIGIAIAIVLSTSRWVERAFYPYMIFFQTVPIIAIAPLLVIWFDAGTTAVTVAAFIVGVFPVIANTLTGLRSVDPALRDLFRLYGGGAVATLFKLKLPSALPNIFTGLRIAGGLAVIGAIVGEFVASQGEGLGILVLVAMRQGATDFLFAAVLTASVLGLLLFGAVQLAGWLMLRRWHASEQR